MIFNLEQQQLYTSRFLNALSVERNLSTKTLLAYRCDINGLLTWFDSQNFTNINDSSISSYLLTKRTQPAGKIHPPEIRRFRPILPFLKTGIQYQRNLFPLYIP